MFSLSERFYFTLEEIKTSDVENEYTEQAIEILENRLKNSDFSEFTEEESDIIAYATVETDDFEVDDGEIYRYLLPMVKKMGISEETAKILEQIGIKLTYDGHDCHKYGMSGSPIDIEYIQNMIFKVRDKKIDEKRGYKYLVVSKDTIWEWAYLIEEFWDEYPDY